MFKESNHILWKNFGKYATVFSTVINLGIIVQWLLICSTNWRDYVGPLVITTIVYIAGSTANLYSKYQIETPTSNPTEQKKLIINYFEVSLGKFIQVFTTSVLFALALNFLKNRFSFGPYVVTFIFGAVLYMVGAFLSDKGENNIKELQKK